MYLLDTDTLIYLLKGEPSVIENLRRHRSSRLATSVICLMELYYGAYKSKNIPANLAKVKSVESILENIPVREETVEIFGMLKAQLESAGTPLDGLDLIIAASALSHNGTVVTSNLRHFQRVAGLRLENWASG